MNRLKLFLFFFLAFSFTAHAAKELVYFRIADKAKQVIVTDEPAIWIDTLSRYDYNNIPGNFFLNLNSYNAWHLPVKISSFIWLKVSIANNTNQVAETFIYNMPLVDVTMFRFKNGAFVDSVNRSIYQPPESGNMLLSGMFAININPADTIQLLFRSRQLVNTWLLPLTLYESSSIVSLFESALIAIQTHLHWEYFVLGLIFFQLLYSIVQWNVNRRKEYGFYFMYIVFMALFLLMRLESNYQQVVFFSYYPSLMVILSGPLNYMAYLMYFKFGRFFLDLKNTMPRLNKAVKIIEWVIVAYIFFLLFYSTGLEESALKKILGIAMAIMLFISSIAFISTAAQMKSRVARFFLAGIAIYTIGAFTNFIIRSFFNNINTGFDSIVIFQVSIVIEVLCLNIALAIKARKNEEEKIASQSKFENELNELQMKALRSQMNPHFIFNSLNSVQRYILKNDKNNAVQYLQKFASLMRLILDNSEKKMVPLNDEIIMLDLYMHLESLRFDQGMDFEIIVDETTQKEDLLIPSMILQPFVENAILHGLMHKEERGKIKIEISRHDHVLKCLIEDNGIGREKAELIKNKKTVRHISRGLGITKARIDLLNQVNKSKNTIVITDLKDENNIPSGTRVEVFIPFGS